MEVRVVRAAFGACTGLVLLGSSVLAQTDPEAANANSSTLRAIGMPDEVDYRVLQQMMDMGRSRPPARPARAPTSLSEEALAAGRQAPSAAVSFPEATPEGARSWFKQDFLFGDWGGARPWLADKGISFNGSIVSDLLGNVTGGRSQGFEPAASLGIEMIADLHKLVGIPGAEFHTSMIWRTGNNLSDEYIGNLLTVAQLYGGQNLRLYNLYWQQSLFDDTFRFKVGRLGAFDDFLSSPIYWNYINNGFDGNPKGIFFNIPPFGNTVYPTSSWGLFMQYQPEEKDWYVQAGAYPINSKNGANSVSGTNFTFDFDQGVGVLAQGGYRLNFKPGDEGLPGAYSMGVFTNVDNDYPEFLDPDSVSESNSGLYWMLQQMVWREPGETNRKRLPGTWGFDAQEGLTLWAAIVYTPDDEISPYPVYSNMGAVYQGPIPGREQDFVAFGWAFLGAGDDFGQATGQDYESVIELNYRCNLTRFFYIQPGLQYVIQPGATGDIPDALVLGAQVGVVF